MQIGTIDGRLNDAKSLTDAKFNALEQQMEEIQGFIDEDRQLRD